MIRIRRQQEIPMASMSDIAFLLIIFFIISISFLYKQGLKISLPRKGSPAVLVSMSDVLILELDGKGGLHRNGARIRPDLLRPGQERSAIIRVNRKCPYKHLVRVLEILQKNGISRISLKKT